MAQALANRSAANVREDATLYPKMSVLKVRLPLPLLRPLPLTPTLTLTLIPTPTLTLTLTLTLIKVGSYHELL